MIGKTVSHYRIVEKLGGGGMVKRWAAAAFLATERNFRKIMGYRDLWMLDAILNGAKSAARREVAWVGLAVDLLLRRGEIHLGNLARSL